MKMNLLPESEAEIINAYRLIVANQQAHFLEPFSVIDPERDYTDDEQYELHETAPSLQEDLAQAVVLEIAKACLVDILADTESGWEEHTRAEPALPPGKPLPEYLHENLFLSVLQAESERPEWIADPGAQQLLSARLQWVMEAATISDEIARRVYWNNAGAATERANVFVGEFEMFQEQRR